MNLNVTRTSKFFLACFLSFLLVACGVALPQPTYAETSEELKAEADEKQAEADALAEKIDEISGQLVEAHQVEDEANATYEAAEAAKADALERKAAAEAVIESTQGRLSDRVVSMYRSGGALTLLDVLLGASSFSEFLTTWDAIQALNNQDTELIETNRTAQEEAAAAAQEYAEQSAIAKEELERATEAREQIEAMNAELATELANMNEEVAMLISKAEEVEAEEEAAAAAAAAAAEESSSSSYTYSGDDSGNGGTSFDSSVFDGWVIPVSYYGVTCEFGYSPITGSHNGIDLGASYGTPIYAAGPGTVTYVGWYGTGGNAVIINHGNGVQTIYMHQSQTAATVGEYVNAGDLIGYVGTTGLSTGPHLHFQLVINGTPTNPRNYFSF